MKRIIWSVTNDINQDRRMIRICTSLVKGGYQVTLVGRELPSSKPLENFPFQTHRLKCIFHKGPLFYAEFNLRLFFYLRQQKAEILGSVDYDTIKGVTRAASGRMCKVVFDSHEWFEEVPELTGRSRVKQYWQRIARHGIPKTDIRYTVSEAISAELERSYGKPFLVIHNFPLLDPIEPGSVRENLIVYAGVLNIGRGLPELIQAMHEIDAKLWLIGDGDIRDELWKLTLKENLTDKIFFKGLLSPPEMEQLLRRARVGVNLLDSSSGSYRLSLANKFFDYVHAGLPQIFMDFPEYQRFYRQFRVGAPVLDLKKSSLVYSINHLLEDRNYWFNTHLECLHARLEWCWQKEEPRLLEIFNAL